MAAVSNPHAPGDAGPADNFAAVTKSDTDDLAAGPCRSLFVGVGGDVVAVTVADVAVTFKNVVSGATLPVIARRVNSTSTTATDIVALY
jgi:hypothetical protein